MCLNNLKILTCRDFRPNSRFLLSFPWWSAIFLRLSTEVTRINYGGAWEIRSSLDRTTAVASASSSSLASHFPVTLLLYIYLLNLIDMYFVYSIHTRLSFALANIISKVINIKLLVLVSRTSCCQIRTTGVSLLILKIPVYLLILLYIFRLLARDESPTLSVWNVLYPFCSFKQTFILYNNNICACAYMTANESPKNYK